MSEPGRLGSVIVVARDSMSAARVEAALHALAGWRIEVCKPRHLRGLVEEYPEAIVAVLLTDTETRRILHDARTWSRRPAVLVLSGNPAKLWTPAFRALGVRAALPLRASADELAGAVRAVHAGLLVLHPEALATPRDTAAASATPLTSREREILEMMADGAHNRTIGARLGISRHTVKFHVTSILTKLGAESRTEAVTLALRGGLLAV
jgi:DNA-binding NarL/FixJ family response regulator